MIRSLRAKRKPSATRFDGHEASILGADAAIGGGALLESVYDRATGRWFAPPQDDDDGVKRALAASQGISVEELDDRLGREGAKFVRAVLDTGVLRDHPLLRDCVIEEVDYTGEGPADQHGHGTAIALILRAEAPRSPLLNVKVMRCDGQGSAEAIIKGLAWVRRYSATHPGLTVEANLGCGVYASRAWRLDCHGDCGLCRAAIRAAEAGVLITAPSGNEPGLTACPATAGVYGKHPGISAVPAADQSAHPPSSSGRSAAAGGRVADFVPVR